MTTATRPEAVVAVGEYQGARQERDSPLAVTQDLLECHPARCPATVEFRLESTPMDDVTGVKARIAGGIACRNQLDGVVSMSLHPKGETSPVPRAR